MSHLKVSTDPTLLSSEVCGSWPEGGQDADGVGLSRQESIACDSDSTGSDGRPTPRHSDYQFINNWLPH